jgi:thiamine-phosphate pyrophosphorylase
MGLLQQAKQNLSVPIVAIGGINAENSAALIEGGADILAVIHALFVNTGAVDEIANNARELVNLFQ